MTTQFITSAPGVASHALFGWFCMLMHDYPEAEGVVWFNGRPQPGQRFMLPSSKYTEEWEVRSVNDHDMSFTAIQTTRQNHN